MEVLVNFENKPLFFRDPEKIVVCKDPKHFNSALKELEHLSASGYWLAGFISYEAGYCLEEKLSTSISSEFPLLMFGAYNGPENRVTLSGKTGNLKIDNLKSNVSFEDYSRNIERIRQHISIGDVYQITYCVKYKFDLSGDPYALYKELFRRQPVPYPAYIDTADFQILSLSPERFIKKNDDRVLTEPMKGTWHRGNNAITDIVEKRKFYHDQKNRAENIMIADLLRNDLGRIGNNIAWQDLFKVTAYNTLFQMTSTVTAKVPPDKAFSTLLSALFPSGSVTGAPKIRAMEIIREIEKEERNVYTGAIGYVSPDGGMYFNVPIRTIIVRGGKCEMGIGGGIIWDSTPEGEWAETRLKASFLQGVP